MSDRDYPSTVLEVVDNAARFRATALRAVRVFAASNPWSGTIPERKEKLRGLNKSLAAAYNIPEPELPFGRIDGSSSGSSHYIPSHHRIVLEGKLSVVTYMHEFAHARRMGERSACRWSINIFRKCFPLQYSRLVGRGHMLIRPADVATEISERRTS